MGRYLGEDSLPRITDEEFSAERAKAGRYSACILKAGPKYVPPDSEFRAEIAPIIYQHGRRNMALHQAGLMPVICPIADGSGISGMCVFDLTAEEAAEVMEQDPGVKAGVFTYEIHPCLGFLGGPRPGQ